MLAIEDFNNVNDFIRYIKGVTGTTVTCSLTLQEVKAYITLKHQCYLDEGLARRFKVARNLGLQKDCVLVINQVGFCCNIKYIICGK